MKTLILFLILPFFSYSQIYLQSEFDPKNAFYGSEVNEPAYDGTFSIGFRDNDFNIQATYENFKAIDFYSLGFQGGYVFNHEKPLKFGLMGGLGWIQRNVDWLQKVLFLSASVSGQVEYHFGSFFVSVRPELRLRGDLQEVVYSNYVGLSVKLW